MLKTVQFRCARGIAVALLSTAALVATGTPGIAAHSAPTIHSAQQPQGAGIGTGVSAQRSGTVRTTAKASSSADLAEAQERYEHTKTKVATKQMAADKAAIKAVDASDDAKVAAKKAGKKGASSATKKKAKKAADKAEDALWDYQKAAKELATAKQEDAQATQDLAAAQGSSKGASTPQGAISNAPTTPTGASTPSGSSALDRNRASILDQVNQARSQAGCGPLKYNSLLEHSAQPYAEDMSEYHYMSHVSRTGETFDVRIWATGYGGNRIGENLGEGFSTATAVFSAWMKSPSHRENILNCKFAQIGVGYAPSGGYWVQHFGG